MYRMMVAAAFAALAVGFVHAGDDDASAGGAEEGWKRRGAPVETAPAVRETPSRFEEDEWNSPRKRSASKSSPTVRMTSLRPVGGSTDGVVRGRIIGIIPCDERSLNTETAPAESEPAVQPVAPVVERPVAPTNPAPTFRRPNPVVVRDRTAGANTVRSIWRKQPPQVSDDRPPYID